MSDLTDGSKPEKIRRTQLEWNCLLLPLLKVVIRLMIVVCVVSVRVVGTDPRLAAVLVLAGVALSMVVAVMYRRVPQAGSLVTYCEGPRA